MMKLRKVFACVTMCFMVLPLTGCGTSQATETKENAEAAEVTLKNGPRDHAENADRDSGNV